MTERLEISSPPAAQLVNFLASRAPAKARLESFDSQTSATAQAYLRLRALIFQMNRVGNGRLRLHSRMLSQGWGMSRTPVREAIARLAHEGILHIVPRCGTFLVRKTKAETLDILIVWAALESTGARLAAQSASRLRLSQLRELIFSFEHARGEIVDPFECCLRFHTAILALCNCPQIVELIEGLLFHIRLAGQRVPFGRGWSEELVFDQERIADSLCDRDPDRAARLVQQHILGLREKFERIPDTEWLITTGGATTPPTESRA